jgi:hypothetical protein
MKKSDQDIISDAIEALFESGPEDLGDDYERVRLNTPLAKGQAKILHKGKLVGKVIPKYAMGDENDPDREFVAIGLEHQKDGSHKEVVLKPSSTNKGFQGALDALKAHHKKQKIGEFVN